MNNIKNVWIETDIKGPIQGGTAELNDNSDVIVTFDDNEKYVATFFTYENIEWLRKENQKTGECLNGKYFFATNSILIDKLNREEILNVIDHLIKKGEFYTVFDKVNE